MNLKTLALVACCLAMPVMAGAQDMMAKDSTMSMKKGEKGMKKGMKKHGMDMKKEDMDMKKEDMDMKKDHKDMKKGHKGMKHMATGPECARGCPTSAGIGGLTGVQFLALQQELRDRGCGNNHVTGVLDAPTRAAIKACAKKWDVAATPAAVLTKMNIGYTPGS